MVQNWRNESESIEQNYENQALHWPEAAFPAVKFVPRPLYGQRFVVSKGPQHFIESNAKGLLMTGHNTENWFLEAKYTGDDSTNNVTRVQGRASNKLTPWAAVQTTSKGR